MTFDLLAGGLLAVGCIVYLTIALLFPERF